MISLQTKISQKGRKGRREEEREREGGREKRRNPLDTVILYMVVIDEPFPLNSILSIATI